MDSDRSSTSDKLKLRVQRITQEAQVTKSFTWVTEGREIENYIPREIASQYFGTPVHFNKFDHFDKKYKAKKGVETFDKAAFATDLTLQNYYTKAALEGHLDLNSKMNEIISYIRRCNN